MPTATDDTDILEHPATATASTYTDTEPLPLPPRARRGEFPLFALLRGLLSASSRWFARMQQYPSHERRFESATDLLARKHPDLYIGAMSGIG